MQHKWNQEVTGPRTIEDAIRTLRIIIGALWLGTAVFGVVALAVVKSAGPMLAWTNAYEQWIAVGVGAMLVFGGLVGWMMGRGMRSQGEPVHAISPVRASNLVIVQAALLEGPSLLAAVAAMLAGPAPLVVTVLGLAGLALMWIGVSRKVTDWCGEADSFTRPW